MTRRADFCKSLLLRSASRFLLYREGGATDAGLRRQAEDDAQSCRWTDPDVAPELAFFPPTFVDFFAAAR